MRLRLRPAVPDDAPALTAVARAAKAHWGYPAAALDAWRDELTVTPATLRERLGAVAERDGRVVGFCLAALEPPAITDLWIDPAAMGEGVGRALLERVVDRARARGVGTMSIDADPHAAGFYERAGAVRTGGVPAPIDGEPGRVRPRYALDVRGPLFGDRPSRA